MLLEIFFSFVKIGFTSFGGLSMLSLITEEMLQHGWMTVREITDIAAIAEMTPGPLGLNCATFAGMKVAGVAGALAANLGALTPTLTVGLLVAVFFEMFRKNTFLEALLSGIRPVCVGMVASVVLTLAISNYYPSASLDLISVGIGALAFLLLLKFKLSVPAVIGISAFAGLITSFF